MERCVRCREVRPIYCHLDDEPYCEPCYMDESAEWYREQEPEASEVTGERPAKSVWRDQRLEGWYADGDFHVGAPLYITPYPDGIRVICGDLDRLHAMSPKAMRGFAIRLLEMAEHER